MFDQYFIDTQGEIVSDEQLDAVSSACVRAKDTARMAQETYDCHYERWAAYRDMRDAWETATLLAAQAQRDLVQRQDAIKSRKASK